MQMDHAIDHAGDQQNLPVERMRASEAAEQLSERHGIVHNRRDAGGDERSRRRDASSYIMAAAAVSRTSAASIL
jgi:hypothetical protein